MFKYYANLFQNLFQAMVYWKIQIDFKASLLYRNRLEIVVQWNLLHHFLSFSKRSVVIAPQHAMSIIVIYNGKSMIYAETDYRKTWGSYWGNLSLGKLNGFVMITHYHFNDDEVRYRMRGETVKELYFLLVHVKKQFFKKIFNVI